jgi:thioredoxin reductase
VQKIFAAGDVPEYERKFYFVIETKPGDVATALADAVADLMILSTNAFLVSLNGWES